jgi:hypothetical protein
VAIACMKSLGLISLLIWLVGCGAPSTRQAGPLSAEQARLLARQAANAEAQALYQCQPFDNGPSARLEGGRWVWQDRRAYGKSDVEARVSFAPDGSGRTVQVLLLDNRILSRLSF